MIKNYSNTDKKIAIKLKKILLKNYTPIETNDDTSLSSNQSDSQADFIALRIIDNLIRFNQTFRFSQVTIKANMGKYKKKGSDEKLIGGVVTRTAQKKEEAAKKNEEAKKKEEAAKKTKNDEIELTKIQELEEEIKEEEQKIRKDIEGEAATKIKNAVLTKAVKNKLNKLRFEKAAKNELIESNNKLQELKEAKKRKELEELLNQFDEDNKFPSSFEALLNSYSLLQNIDRNYRDLRPIFNNLSVLVFNDLNDVLDETDELIKKGDKSLNVGKSAHTKKNISFNLDDYQEKLNKTVSIFNNIYNDFKQRKQTFNTNIKTGSGFGYLAKIRNI